MMRHRWFTAVMLCYAVLTTYSRIYLGVHYPMQILFGIVLGTVVALSLWKLFDTLDRRFGWKIERKT
jgi:undecaprenyl-diphosphatase